MSEKSFEKINIWDLGSQSNIFLKQCLISRSWSDPLMTYKPEFVFVQWTYGSRSIKTSTDLFSPPDRISFRLCRKDCIVCIFGVLDFLFFSKDNFRADDEEDWWGWESLKEFFKWYRQQCHMIINPCVCKRFLLFFFANSFFNQKCFFFLCISL